LSAWSREHMPLRRTGGRDGRATIAADLAKKSRTPNPPRRVQAPKQRSTPRPADRRRRWLIIGAAVGLIFLIAGGAAFAYFALGGGTSTDGTLRAAGCTIVKEPAQGRQHVPTLAKNFKYNTFPPTTGPHFPSPVPYDFYSDPVEQYRLVHNLEHGSIVIQYGEDVPESTVADIREWYLKDPNGIVVAPFPELGDKVVFEAWTSPDAAPGQTPGPGEGVVVTCPTFDPARADDFTDTYGFKGPERFPRDQLVPGA
jgi:Protein of unknown function (DUF3105)